MHSNEDDNSYALKMITVVIENVCKMSVVSFALAVVFIIRLFSTSAFRVPNNDSCSESFQDSFFSEVYLLLLTQPLVRLSRHTHTEM